MPDKRYLFDLVSCTRAALCVASAVYLVGCSSAESPNADGRQYGTPVDVGDGHARMYVQTKSGVPTEIGVALDRAALDGLPAPSATTMPGHADMHAYLLSAPANNATPYTFVELDWNPAGHPPAPIYDKPHFDVHFYKIPLSLRDEIDPARSDFATRASRLPTSDYLLSGYINTSVVAHDTPAEETVPHMGLHWLNPASPELPPTLAPFTLTYLSGSFDGKVIFAEPMVTRAFLLSNPDTLIDVPVASKHDPAGYYPTAYRVSWDDQAKEYRIALTKLAWKQ